MQDVLVGLIVAGCTVYAAWGLLPVVWRRSLALRLSTGPWPAPVTRALQRAAKADAGCSGGGCKGCATTGDGAAKPAPGVQTVHFHPPRRSR
jgi:hypothetical protein